MEQTDARSSARASFELEVSFRRDETDAKPERAGKIQDFGVGGAFVESERPPRVGALILVKLEAPSAWDPLELPAEVRWVDETRNGFGVSFRELDPQQTAALAAFVDVAGFGGSDSADPD